MHRACVYMLDQPLLYFFKKHFILKLKVQNSQVVFGKRQYNCLFKHTICVQIINMPHLPGIPHAKTGKDKRRLYC